MLIWKLTGIIYMLGQNDSFLKGNRISRKYNSKNTIVFSNVTFWNNFFIYLRSTNFRGYLFSRVKKKMYFAGINFRELKKFWFFASINFRESAIFRIFARINFTQLQKSQAIIESQAITECIKHVSIII